MEHEVIPCKKRTTSLIGPLSGYISIKPEHLMGLCVFKFNASTSVEFSGAFGEAPINRESEMNREAAKILAPIIQAFGEGKDINFRGSPINEPSFKGNPSQYSIAEPKPRQDVWLNLDKGQCIIGSIYKTREFALESPYQQWEFRAIHYRRVDDEDDKETMKQIVVKFYNWWVQQPGRDTEQGFDAWWNAKELIPEEGE